MKATRHGAAFWSPERDHTIFHFQHSIEILNGAHLQT
jgi:hypothetical protein